MKKLSEPLVRRGCATMHVGDMRVVVPALGKFTACVTDPPYEIGFMGKTWDSSGIAFDAKTWRVVLDALKPGGLLLAFGGTRTFHRIAVAIEDAGFEIRDCIMWLYGSGFPKSHDISKAIDKASGATRRVVGTRSDGCGNTNASMHKRDGFASARDKTYAITKAATAESARWEGYGTALKPAFEPIIVAMKPLDGTFAANAQQHGVAGINVDAGRVRCAGGSPSAALRKHEQAVGHGPSHPGCYDRPIQDRTSHATRTVERPGEHLGRWPANVILDEDAAQQLDVQSGARGGTLTHPYTNQKHGGSVHGKYGSWGERTVFSYYDSGGASRFFYTAKTSTAERQAGLERYAPNLHPTVKPIDLMRYLVKLVTMPSGTRILDPFAGSGSTLVACRQLGIKCVGVDLDPTNCRTADGRLSYRVGVSKYRKLKLRGRRTRKES